MINRIEQYCFDFFSTFIKLDKTIVMKPKNISKHIAQEYF